MQMYRAGGVKIFFRGLSSCLVRALPLNGVTLSVYELASKMLDRKHHVTLQ
jgi:hypothetical protein